MDRTLILAADVGGTKAYLGIFDADDDNFAPLCERRYQTPSYPDPESLLKDFIAEAGLAPTRVVLGVPGPTRPTPIEPVNLPWHIDPAPLAAALGVDQVHLLNDLQATAYGLLTLKSEDLLTLNEGRADPEGNIAVIAAGTGLGEGGLCWTGGRYVAIASEGGHASFAPGTHLEIELWHWLYDKFGHISWERLISGPGLVHIYEFLCHRGDGDGDLDLSSGDPSRTIAEAALGGQSALATEALDLFVSLYGAEAGNLALKMMAVGGLYVGGGIAPKILPRLQEGRFWEAMIQKGRMADMLRAIPVKVVLNDKTGLLGAAYWGKRADEYL